MYLYNWSATIAIISPTSEARRKLESYNGFRKSTIIQIPESFHEIAMNS